MLEHQDYLEAVRELTDWLMTAGEELQHWSETSGDSTSIKKKLADVQVRKSIYRLMFVTKLMMPSLFILVF